MMVLGEEKRRFTTRSGLPSLEAPASLEATEEERREKKRRKRGLKEFLAKGHRSYSIWRE